MVVVVDDENRENEGDLTIAAQFVTPEAINFMAKEGRGLVCLALTPERCDELGLDLMAAKNESAFETAFTVSIEARTGRQHGHLGRRPSADDSGGDRLQGKPARSRPARPRVPPQGQGRWRPRACRADGGRGRSRPSRRADPGRRDLRDHERRRHDGPGQGPRPVLRASRSEDGHRRRARRLPPTQREARRARRLDQAARPPSASSWPSATARWSTTSTTSPWSRARSTAPTTCSCGSTRSASPAMSFTRCAATAASSSTPRSR